jgi:hypothetical protein
MAPDDIPMATLRSAAVRVRAVAKAKAVSHGGTVTFAEQGRMMVEFPDGRRCDIGEVNVETVRLEQRVWMLR